MMSFSLFWTNTGNGLWVFVQWRTYWESFHSTRSVTSSWSSSVTKLGTWFQWQQLIVPVWSYFVGATRALQNTRLTFSRSVPFTVEFRYSAAEYALAEESVKQNSLHSSPPMYLGNGWEGSGARLSYILHHSCCCDWLKISSQSFFVSTVPEWNALL